jgi:predicted nuclease of predicted toxin-antitoxin system
VTRLIDENLSFRLANAIVSRFPIRVTCGTSALARASDAEIWEFSKHQGLAIVTLDSDFHERSLLMAYPPKVVGCEQGIPQQPQFVRSFCRGRKTSSLSSPIAITHAL